MIQMYRNKLKVTSLDHTNDGLSIVLAKSTPFPKNIKYVQGMSRIPLEDSIRKIGMSFTYSPSFRIRDQYSSEEILDHLYDDYKLFLVSQLAILKHLNRKVSMTRLASYLREVMEMRFQYTTSIEASAWDYTEEDEVIQFEFSKLAEIQVSVNQFELTMELTVREIFRDDLAWSQIIDSAKTKLVRIKPICIVWEKGYAPSDPIEKFRILQSYCSILRSEMAKKYWNENPDMSREEIAVKMEISTSSVRRYLPTKTYGARRKKTNNRPNNLTYKASGKTQTMIANWRTVNPSGKQKDCAKELGKGIATIRRYWNK